MDFWTLYANGFYNFIMLTLGFLLAIIMFLSYVLIIIVGIMLLIGIPAGICYGIYELYRYCANRSNIETDLHLEHSSDEVNIELSHVTQTMPIESSLQQSENRIQSANYGQV
jgi:hypothetical protein